LEVTRYNRRGDEICGSSSERQAPEPVFLFILESLGSTELLFILVMALVFFGPRKLPQLSRKLGKSVAEFRRASEDFKSTWEREVALESSISEARNPTVDNRSMLNDGDEELTPSIRAVSSDEQVARDSKRTAEPIAASTDENNSSEPLQKRDWL
jgi:TatA/E family protein of Tat protein translocase